MTARSDPWDQLAAGVGCPFDPPREDTGDHWDKVATLQASTLYLHKVQTYRGYSLLVYDRVHATQLSQLEEADAVAFMSDLQRAVRVLSDVLRPDHMNVELLGNVVPHLHWHLIPRYKADARWGRPIWTTTDEEMPRLFLPEIERAALLEELRRAFAT